MSSGARKFQRSRVLRTSEPDPSLDRITAEVYAAWWLFTNLGFEPEEVFIGTPVISNAPERVPYATVTARRGTFEFVYWIAPLRSARDVERWQEHWLAFQAAQPGRDRAELDLLVQGTLTFRSKVELMAALVHKGWELPGTDDAASAEAN